MARLEAIKDTAKDALRENERNVQVVKSNHMTDGVQDKNAKKEAKGKLDANKGRKLAASPTKSPSSGLHKPTWKPSSKPAEHRTLSGVPKGDANPSKSPSAGLHKPTWKPSAKPAEHASKQGAALPRQ